MSQTIPVVTFTANRHPYFGSSLSTVTVKTPGGPVKAGTHIKFDRHINRGFFHGLVLSVGTLEVGADGKEHLFLTFKDDAQNVYRLSISDGQLVVDGQDITATPLPAAMANTVACSKCSEMLQAGDLVMDVPVFKCGELSSIEILHEACRVAQ